MPDRCDHGQIEPEDCNLGAIPFGHSYGLGNLVLPLIAQGTAVIASTEILPDALAAQIERFGATVLPSVPAVLRGLAESGVDADRLRSLRRIISAGAPLRGGSCERFFWKSSRVRSRIFTARRRRAASVSTAPAKPPPPAAAWGFRWKEWKCGWTMKDT